MKLSSRLIVITAVALVAVAAGCTSASSTPTPVPTQVLPTQTPVATATPVPPSPTPAVSVSNAVRYSPPWKTGDKLLYTVRSGEGDIESGFDINRLALSTRLELEVLETNEDGLNVIYRFQAPKYEDPNLQDNSLADSLAAVFSGLEFELLIDNDGNVNELVNWKLAKVSVRFATDGVSQYFSQFPFTDEEIEQIIEVHGLTAEGFEQTIAELRLIEESADTPDNVLAILGGDLRGLHAVSYIDMDPDDVIEVNGLAISRIPGNPLPVQGTLRLLSVSENELVFERKESLVQAGLSELFATNWERYVEALSLEVLGTPANPRMMVETRVSVDRNTGLINYAWTCTAEEIGAFSRVKIVRIEPLVLP